jgi:hypothetical protein
MNRLKELSSVIVFLNYMSIHIYRTIIRKHTQRYLFFYTKKKEIFLSLNYKNQNDFSFEKKTNKSIIRENKLAKRLHRQKKT